MSDTNVDPPVLNEYFNYQREYEAKYGDRTVVLMQIGSFYEIYERERRKDKADEPGSGSNLGKAQELSTILNVFLTKKNKNKDLSDSNPWLIGFPVASYEKNRDLLLSHNYTIVRVDQQGTGKNVTRYMAEVLSPGTVLDGASVTDNYIVVIYIESAARNQNNGDHFDQYKILAGLSAIDVTTGENIVCDVYSKEEDKIFPIHEMYRFLTAHHPRELVIYLEKFPRDVADRYLSFITETLELNRYPNVLTKIDEVNKEYLKIDYQAEVLSKVFESSGKTPVLPELPSPKSQPSTPSPLKGVKALVLDVKTRIIEKLNLERSYYGTISYVLLLQYCYEHNANLIARIKEPNTEWNDGHRHLVLTHNAILQLNLLPSTDKNSPDRVRPCVDSLFSILNQTSTALGKRYLRDRLLNPVTDIEELEQYYNIIEELTSDSELMTSLETSLKGLPDLDRYQRKLRLGTIKPHEFAILFKGYLKIVDIYSAIVYSKKPALSKILFHDNDVNEFNGCLTYVLSLICLEKLEKCKLVDDRMEIVENFLWDNVDSTADAYAANINSYEERLRKICNHLNGFLLSNKGTKGKLITLELNGKKKKGAKKASEDDDDDDEPVGLGSLMTTNHKANIIKKAQVDTNLVGTLRFTTVKSQTLISSDKIDLLFYELDKDRASLERHLYDRYVNLVQDLDQRYSFFNAVAESVAKIDFVKSAAKTALKYQYHRPRIDRTAEKSYFRAEDIRHPIIERIIDSEYITNSLSLGRGQDTSPYGMLLYSLNGGGKSSMIKCIGLNIVMAQAGLFVPSKLVYYPYRRIITRLSGHDDLFRGDSSFMVEMKELRTILKNSDEYSLVLTDELSKGSESISSTALTISSLITLIGRKATFVFSTHLHEIPDTEYIKNMGEHELRICHLSTIYNEETEELVYDRKLKVGSGSSLYGLEVARWLKLDKEFIDKAYEIRRYLLDEGEHLLNPKTSRYNSKVYVDSCLLCGANSDLATHHIEEQHKADDAGFIGHYHKNSKFNLAVLCRNCHEWLHQNKLSLANRQIPNGRMVVLN